MEYLLDTNVLIALLNAESPARRLATNTIAQLSAAGDRCWLAPQVLVEFWAVATRPIAANGLNWTVEKTALQIQELLDSLPLLSETPELFRAWLN
jgi:predicted nucleic acid-binding protein